MSAAMHTHNYEELAKKAYEFYHQNNIVFDPPWNYMANAVRKEWIDLVTFIKVQP